jgi:hypothetical protein
MRQQREALLPMLMTLWQIPTLTDRFPIPIAGRLG